MDHVAWTRREALARPPVICAFGGWNDGGEAASVAARYLVERWHAEPVARVDPEDFFDFQVSRPTVRLEDGVSRRIEWPKCEFAAASVEGRDVLVYTSPEPNNRWRTYTQTVIDAARELGASLLVTLGAFLTDVPHSRAVPVVGSAVDEDTAARLGLSRSQYEGPTGVVGVLHDASIRAGLPSVSLWAAVPHYLPAAPNPKAALALVERASTLLGVPVQTGPLLAAAAAWEDGVTRLLSENDELREYVEQLESLQEQPVSEARIEGAIPSGDAIAAEVERFLRERDDGPSA